MRYTINFSSQRLSFDILNFFNFFDLLLNLILLFDNYPSENEWFPNFEINIILCRSLMLVGDTDLDCVNSNIVLADKLRKDYA